MSDLAAFGEHHAEEHCAERDGYFGGRSGGSWTSSCRNEIVSVEVRV